jgi:hypothetical protein
MCPGCFASVIFGLFATSAAAIGGFWAWVKLRAGMRAQEKEDSK